MVEVFENYKDINEHTYFRSTSLFDLYLKESAKKNM